MKKSRLSCPTGGSFCECCAKGRRHMKMCLLPFGASSGIYPEGHKLRLPGGKTAGKKDAERRPSFLWLPTGFVVHPFKSQAGHFTSQVPFMQQYISPISHMFKHFGLCAFTVFPFSQKLIIARDCWIIPVRFCARPFKPFSDIFIWMCRFIRLYIATYFAGNIVVLRLMHQCKRPIYLLVITSPTLLPFALFLLPFTFRFFSCKPLLFDHLRRSIKFQHHVA